MHLPAAVHIGFAQQEYNVLETRGYAALSVLLLSGNINDAVTLRLRTIENSALGEIFVIMLCASVCLYLCMYVCGCACVASMYARAF